MNIKEYDVPVDMGRLLEVYKKASDQKNAIVAKGAEAALLAGHDVEAALLRFAVNEAILLSDE